jgi:hypothetical protein
MPIRPHQQQRGPPSTSASQRSAWCGTPAAASAASSIGASGALSAPPPMTLRLLAQGFVPMFPLLPELRLPKRLDIAAVARAAAARMEGTLRSRSSAAA